MATVEPQTPENPSARTEITVNEIYKEQYEHFRRMNDALYKIPPLFIAVIGGLWYFAVLNIDAKPAASTAVFVFTAIASVLFVNVMSRFRRRSARAVSCSVPHARVIAARSAPSS